VRRCTIHLQAWVLEGPGSIDLEAFLQNIAESSVCVSAASVTTWTRIYQTPYVPADFLAGLISSRTRLLIEDHDLTLCEHQREDLPFPKNELSCVSEMISFLYIVETTRCQIQKIFKIVDQMMKIASNKNKKYVDYRKWIYSWMVIVSQPTFLTLTYLSTCCSYLTR